MKYLKRYNENVSDNDICKLKTGYSQQEKGTGKAID